VQVKTILNHVQKFKSFVYGQAKWKELSDKNRALYVEVFVAGGSAFERGKRS